MGLNKRQRKYLAPAALAGAMAGVISFQIFQSHKPAVVSQPPLEAVIGSFGEVVFKSGDGNHTVYLIAQEHYNYANSAQGRVDAAQLPTLPEAQAQVYHILHGLVKKRNLECVVGEGLPGGEFALDAQRKGFSAETAIEQRRALLNYNVAVKFFAANEKEPAYAMYELFNDAIVTFGVDDRKEQRRIQQLKQEDFDMMLHFVPMRDDAKDPEKVKMYSRAVAPLQAEIDSLNYRRSMLYVEAALKASDSLFAAGRIRSRDVAIVIGAAHVCEMVPELEERDCRLYVIKPRSAEPFKIR